MKMNNTFENPNVTYQPSGFLGNSTLKTSITYALFVIVGSVLMQAPIAVVSGLAAALLDLGGGTTMPMIFCYIGLATCFFYLGPLFPIIIRPCTKLMHCRNPKFEEVAIIAMIILTVVIRIAFAHVMSERMDVEINWLSWLEWGGMLILFFVGSLAWEEKPMPPYCEKCRKYMKKEIFKTSSSDSVMPVTLGILHKLCVADDEVYFEESEKIHFTNDSDEFLAIGINSCPVCNDGFVIAVQQKKEIGEDNKEHKVHIVAYANSLNSKQTAKLRELQF